MARRADDVAALLYTSGTTGRPKGAMLSHRAMTSCALALGRAWRFGTSDVLLHALPLFHGHGLFVSSNVALAAGARLQLLPRFDAGEVIDALPRATVFMGVPTFYHRLLGDERLTPESCSAMRLFTCGSAPLAAAVQRAFATRTGHEIVERYGATETMILCTNPLDGERRPGSVGRPLPEVDLRIADDADHPLPAGATGNDPGPRRRACSTGTGICRRRRAPSSRPTASSGRATSDPSAPTATSRSPGARRT